MKLLTEFENGPKTLAAGNAGAGVYARALAYCGKYETDGFVPKEWVEQAVAREGLHDLPDQLVAAGLWIRRGTGYEIPGFPQLRGGSKREPLSPQMRQKIIERDGDICRLCSRPIALGDAVHIDHILPVAHGGKTLPGNLQVAHARCNLRKGARAAV